MNDINIAGIDLNLLVVVDAILRQRSATLASAELHVTQSAVSSSLGRARALFGDPLVVRTGRGFALTPRAEAIAPRLRALLEGVHGVLDDAAFRPETTTRRFTIACTDAVEGILLPVLLPRFEARFPRARLRTVTLDHLASTGLERADVDLLIGAPTVVPTGCEAEALLEDPLVAIVRADHPEVGRRLRLATYAALPHAELALFGEPDDHVDRALAALRLRRHVQVTVPHLMTLPFAIAGSDRVATLIRSVAQAFAGPLSLRICEPPLELAPRLVQQLWHRRCSDDPGGRLLRELVREAALGLRRSAGAPGRTPSRRGPSSARPRTAESRAQRSAKP